MVVVVVVVIVIVMVVVIVTVIVVVIVIVVMVVTTAVSTPFGGEGRTHEVDRQAQAAHELVEHVIVLVGEAAERDRERDVAIAEMIRRAREKERIVRGRDAEILVGGDDCVRLTVVGEQTIAIGEHAASLQADGDLPTVLEVRAKSRFLARVVVEDEPAGEGRRRIVVEAADGAHDQNKKYRCVRGSVAAGSQVSSAPSARTSYVCGSTSIFGKSPLCTMSRFVIPRVLSTATVRLARRSRSGTPESSAAFDTKVRHVSPSAPPNAPNMGR